MSYELYIEPVRKPYNPTNGRFLKGHVPFTKGRKWEEYLSKRMQKRCAKGWQNLPVHRPKTRPDTAGRCRKQVIAITDDGRLHHFSHIGNAAKWVGGCRENVGRCCRLNHSRKELKKPWGHPTGKVNTEHRYMGVRFYFEIDKDIWITKIKQ